MVSFSRDHEILNGQSAPLSHIAAYFPSTLEQQSGSKVVI